MQRKNLVKPLAMLVQTFHQHLFVLICDSNARDLRGIINHFLADRALSLRLRPQHSGQQCASKSCRRKDFHEFAPLEHSPTLPSDIATRTLTQLSPTHVTLLTSLANNLV